MNPTSIWNVFGCKQKKYSLNALRYEKRIPGSPLLSTVLRGGPSLFAFATSKVKMRILSYVMGHQTGLVCMIWTNMSKPNFYWQHWTSQLMSSKKAEISWLKYSVVKMWLCFTRNYDYFLKMWLKGKIRIVINVFVKCHFLKNETLHLSTDTLDCKVPRI